MIPALIITVLIIITFGLILIYRDSKTKEAQQQKRFTELHQAEQQLQYLKDKKQVANVDLSAAELETKIEKLKRKIEKEGKKHA